jgi:hypothetical protein
MRKMTDNTPIEMTINLLVENFCSIIKLKLSKKSPYNESLMAPSKQIRIP